MVVYQLRDALVDRGSFDFTEQHVLAFPGSRDTRI